MVVGRKHNGKQGAKMNGTLEHVDYPHQPGRLYDCPACELGDCECDPGDAPCVSIHCVQADED